MKLSIIRVLIIDDDICKAFDIQKSLEFSGITDIIHVTNQEEAWKVIYNAQNQEKRISLIVTDMNYPLTDTIISDQSAGSKLIKRLATENIAIPVILCSSINYNIREILGCVWYTKLRDLNFDFKDVLEKL